MSSCFNSDWQSRKLALVTGLLAMLACGSAAAQSVSDNLPFESSASGRIYNGTTPLRLWHQTRGYGMEASQTAFGGRLAVDLEDAVGFLDGQFRVSNESQFGIDFGGGFRWMDESFVTGGTRVYGITGWYDGQETTLNNYFNQLGVSLESLGQHVDFRMNANIPLENMKSGDTIIETDAVTYTGNFLTLGTIVPTDVALRVVDFEVAPRIFDLNAWVYGGGYQMDGDGISDFGAKGGVRGYVTNDLAVDVGVQNDDVFGTNTVFQVIWTPGRTGAGPTSWVHTLADRMREQVYRNTYVATDQVNRAGSINLTDVDGDDIRVVHVDFTSTAPGDGSFENPYTTIDSASGTGSQQGDIILVHAQPTPAPNVYAGQSITLKDEQRFLGEGGGISHTVVTQQRGDVTLPETFAGALNGTRPTMLNSAGNAAVTLAGITTESENFTQMEVSNFTFDGGASAIISAADGVAAVNINNVEIENTTGNGIALAAMTQTLANGTTRSRFAPTIDKVTFDNVGGDDMVLTSTTSQTTISHATAISNITSTNGNGVGINLVQNQRAATINNFDWNGGTTGQGALRIFEAGTQGAVTLSNSATADDNVITGGETDVAYAILLENSAATHTVTGTKVQNMGGDAIVVNDGAANMNFTGTIEQTNAAASATTSILQVTGGHTGSLTFTELVANGGVINATRGDGLQFNDADGVYTFNDEAVFDGVSQAINVVNSDAVITMLDVQIEDTTDTAITFNGGDSNLAFTGHIEQTTAQTVLSVVNGHEGTLVFNEVDANAGVINATNGAGLVFNNADGAYTFNDEVALSGTTAAISVTGDSEGTFTFSDADIDYSGTGAAVTIAGSNVQAFTISGDINVTGVGTALPVSISNNTGGSITFNSPITSVQGGILVTTNTDTTVRFAGQTTLTTGANTGVSLTDNTNGGVRFDALDITTSTGDGFVADNTDNLTVQGTGNTITVTAGAAGTVGLTLDDVEVGSAGVAFQSVTTTGGDNGIVLNNVRGGAVTIGNAGAAAGTGGTITNSIGAGVLITDAANVTLNGLAINGAGTTGISASQTTATASSLTVNNTNVTNPAGDGVSLSNMSNVSLNTMVIDGNGTTGDGINIDHNNASQSVVRITSVDVTNAGDIGIDYNRSATALSRLTLTDVDVSDSGAEGIAMDIAGSSTVDITIQAGSSVTNNAGGSAIALNTTGGSKTVNVLIDSGDFDNDNADATIAIRSNSAGSLNTTVTSNGITNSGAVGRAYSQEVVTGTTRLNFNDNTLSNVAASDEVLLTQSSGTFLVVDLPTIETRNGGAQVEEVGTITDLPGGTVPTPTP